MDSSRKRQQNAYAPTNYRSNQFKNNSNNPRFQNSKKRYSQSSERSRSRNYKQSLNKNQNKYQSSNLIRIQTGKQISIRNKQQVSQIKVHFKFDPIKISSQSFQQLISKLEKCISNKLGPVSHFAQSSLSKPNKLIIQLGFMFNSSARKALEGELNKLAVIIDSQQVKLSAKPTQIFEIWLKNQDSQDLIYQQKSPSRKGKKTNKNNRKNKYRSSSSSQSKYSTSSVSSKRSHQSSKNNSKQKDNNRRFQFSKNLSRSDISSQKFNRFRQHNSSRQNKNVYQREQRRSYYETDNLPMVSQQKGKQDNSSLKTLLFFGISYFLNAKGVMDYLDRHQEGPFRSKTQLIWKKIDGSICEYLVGRFQQKMANKLLQIRDNFQMVRYPAVIIESESFQKQDLIQKISQFQINIKTPFPVNPYYVQKWLKQCGKIVQMVSLNDLTTSEGLSDRYNVTFCSKDICNKLKNLQKTKQGICIDDVKTEDMFIPIYRQSEQTSLNATGQRNGQESIVQERNQRDYSVSSRKKSQNSDDSDNEVLSVY